MKRYWLMKSEPDVFSFDHLAKAPKRTTSWEGVRNYQARNFMRDTFRKGDEVLFYHSNTEDAGIYGLAEVVREGYPEQESPWCMVDIRATAKLREPVTRARLAADSRLKGMMVLKRGARLSIQPVTPEEFKIVSALGKPEYL